MSNINKQVWKSTGPGSIIFGTITEEVYENNWLMVKVDWHLPEGRVTDAAAWQMIANLGSVEQIHSDLDSFSKRVSN
jgi:hypothetical protein